MCSVDRKNNDAPKWPIAGGKLFVEIRSWTEDSGLMTYDESYDFMYFVDKFASRVVGQRALSQFYKKNRDKTIFDKLTTQQIAYSILICENMMGVWEEDCVVKETCRTREEIESYVRTATQKYHHKKGTRIPRNHDGWTDEGRSYLKTLMGEFRMVFGNTDFRINLVEHWRTYVSKYHKTSYKRARDIGTMEDVEGYDEEDTLLDLPEDDFQGLPLPEADNICEGYD